MDIPFTDNYEDLSNDSGFQFKFNCQRCGNGYMSTFKKSTTGVLTGALGVVGNIFGGVASNIANTSDDIHRMVAGPQHDKALNEAVVEIKPKFEQCSRCGTWVCRQICWNEERNLCKECAPILAEEMASAQAQHSREEAFAHARMSTEEKHLTEKDWGDQKKAACPKCKAPLKAHAKFCMECGTKLVFDSKCKKCSAELKDNSKFCPECGEKV